MGRLGIRVLLGVSLLSAAAPVFAEQAPAGSPSGEGSAALVEPPAPPPEDVKRIIKQLGSLRDFERLGWILDAAKRQVPPARAELLKLLDQQVQQLIQAEVEARASTVLSTTDLLNPKSAGQRAGGAAASKTSVALNRDQAPPPSARLFPSQSYDDLKAKIERADFTDPAKRGDRFSEFSKLVLGVEDAERRQELSKLLQRRNQEGLQQYLDTQVLSPEGETPSEE